MRNGNQILTIFTPIHQAFFVLSNDIAVVAIQRVMKKITVAFFFQTVQKVQKMFGIFEKATVKFSPTSEQKKYSSPTPLTRVSARRTWMKDN